MLYQFTRKVIDDKNLINAGKFISCQIISKLIEKVLYNWLFRYQSGFRNHHSTNHTWASTTEKLRKLLDEGKAFLSFSESVWHSKPLNTSLLSWILRNQRIATACFSELLGEMKPICWNKQKSSNVLPINFHVPHFSS